MNTDMSKTLEAVAGFLRQAPEGRTAKERADLLVEVAQLIYDDVKFRHPEGEGLDGRDGPNAQVSASSSEPPRIISSRCGETSAPTTLDETLPKTRAPVVINGCGVLLLPPVRM